MLFFCAAHALEATTVNTSFCRHAVAKQAFSSAMDILNGKEIVHRSLDAPAAYEQCAHRRCANSQCVTMTCFTDARMKARKCGGCLCARYCSDTCQKEDWAAGHKRLCKLIRAEREKRLAEQEQPEAPTAAET
jgi:hypothetical protein